MQYFTQVVYLLRSNALTVPYAVYSRTAYIVLVYQGVCAFSSLAHCFPKRVIFNHSITKNIILYDYFVDNSHKYDYN